LGEACYTVPAVGSGDNLDVGCLSGTEDEAPEVGMDGMVDAVFRFIDEQKTLTGVGDCEGDGEETVCTVAESFQRYRGVRGTQFDEGAALLEAIGAVGAGNEGDFLDVVADDELEGAEG